jgi:hypothetical protein
MDKAIRIKLDEDTIAGVLTPLFEDKWEFITCIQVDKVATVILRKRDLRDKLDSLGD